MKIPTDVTPVTVAAPEPWSLAPIAKAKLGDVSYPLGFTSNVRHPVL